MSLWAKAAAASTIIGVPQSVSSLPVVASQLPGCFWLSATGPWALVRPREGLGDRARSARWSNVGRRARGGICDGRGSHIISGGTDQATSPAAHPPSCRRPHLARAHANGSSQPETPLRRSDSPSSSEGQADVAPAAAGGGGRR